AGLLLPDESLSRAASDHVRDQGQTGVIGHTGNDNSSPLKRVKRYVNSDYMYIGENISYGLTSAEEIVSFLLINDGMPSRSHREILLNPKFNLTGVSCGYHRVYKTMCVIVYSRLHR
ncbi:MAG: CAP domain-containing protein, partial [Bacteroidetes bacterium]|nr:CAP domain-containing protein [Bacteroidota bacterium]